MCEGVVQSGGILALFVLILIGLLKHFTSKRLKMETLIEKFLIYYQRFLFLVIIIINNIYNYLLGNNILIRDSIYCYNYN